MGNAVMQSRGRTLSLAGPRRRLQTFIATLSSPTTGGGEVKGKCGRFLGYKDREAGRPPNRWIRQSDHFASTWAYE